jgi:hypothetical protein
VSRARSTLATLLVAATVLFAIGAIAERADGATHVEADVAHAEEGAEAGESVAGVDAESTPLVVIAVVAGLGLAALALTQVGRRRWFLLAVAAIALAWAALDVREVVHQLDESRAGIAVIALGVAVLHLAAAAFGGRLALQRPS